MQLRLPWSSRAPRPRERPRTIDAGGRAFPVEVTRRRGARRYILRLTPDGVVRLTVPPGASIAGGMHFAAGQAVWIAEEWARRRARASWATGTLVWYRGERHALVCSEGAIACGPVTIPRGTAPDVRSALQAHWRTMAAAELPGRCCALGAPHGLAPATIRVRDQRSRWGSCSTRGTIALNWRLIQMPSAVADYVMLHELVHLEHPNHAPAFWRRVTSVCQDWRTAERWLREAGRDLL